MKKFCLLLVFLICIGTFFTACNKKDATLPQDIVSTSPFYCSSYNNENDSLIAANAVYELFSGVADTNCLVQKFGNEACYFEWVAKQIMWSGDFEYIEMLKDKIQNYPQTDNGYFWSWSTTTYWPSDSKGSMHYDGVFRYVAAVYDVLRWEGSTSFLQKIDNTTVNDSPFDSSCGKTVYEKCVLAVDYMLNALNGNEGIICIKEDSVYLSDGKTRFDVNNGVPIWNNTGCVNSSASNYWDNLCFGNYDAYESALLYHAIDSMMNIEKMLGNQDKVNEYATLLQKIHKKYDEFFWSDTAKRYVGCIDAEGNVWDFGFTFLNLEALSYGLGDGEKAQFIFSWIDGKRIVAGDTSTGQDILSYTNILNENLKLFKKIKEPLRLTPRSNTIKIEAVCIEGNYWWSSCDGQISVTKNAGYGKHLENGGYIFYVTYYELIARMKYIGTESVNERFKDVAKVYYHNGLNSDIGTWVEGLCGEFPESGLVCVPFLTDIIGVDASAENLKISPKIPSQYNNVGVASLYYKNKEYRIAVNRDDSLTIQCLNNEIDMCLNYKPQTSGQYLIEIFYNDNQTHKAYVYTDDNGEIENKFFLRNVVKIKYSKV